jgi:acyl-CoA synthetase (AMP-forming)/AMP-acid ligase II
VRSGIQNVPLSVPTIFHRAESMFTKKHIISVVDGDDRFVQYSTWTDRVRRLATALKVLDIEPGDSVATFCWNTQSHLELYFALPCSGRVIHPVNVRLFREEIEFVIRDAGDVAIFVDRSLVGICADAVAGVTEIRHIVVIDDGSDEVLPADPRVVHYESLLDSCDAFSAVFVVDDEFDAAAIWHTSGTTGRPKGVVYSHRAIVLHAMSLLTADSLGLSERDVVMPIVPMFHVGAWGTPYGALMAGSDFALVGRDLRPGTLASALERLEITVSLAVPTVWRSMLPIVANLDLSNLRLPLCGGSSASAELLTSWGRQTGTTMVHAWGMTETGPVTAVSKVRSYQESLSEEEVLHLRTSQGSPVSLVEVRIDESESDESLESDGLTVGELQVRGPWIAGEYHNRADAVDSFTDDQWLRTGDIGTIDGDGIIRLIDRKKDMIKSGGEWISSVDLENAIMAHPLVLEAAVIGIPDARWDERPLACVVLTDESELDADSLRQFLNGRVAKWWIPEVFEFVDSLPKTGVGKFSKKTLREKYAQEPIRPSPKVRADVESSGAL